MHRFRFLCAVALCALLTVGLTAKAQKPTDATGWTNLTPPVGARVVYVSSSSGSDSNSGLTTTAPVASLGKGYSLLRDGMPDQMLLKCGDTWNQVGSFGITKGCNTEGQFQLIGTYGAGPRPVINFAAGGFRGENLGKRRVTFFGLELVGVFSPSSGGITMLCWHDVLIEGCMIRNFNDNIIIEDVGTGFRVLGLRVRRNILADASYIGAPITGKAQGIFIASCDGWVIEENLFDNNGITGSMFAHNVYIHETCGPGDFIANITARSASEGAQQRPGGRMLNNLALENSYGLYFGGPGEVSNNVVIDAKNISASLPRGTGLLIDGNTTVKGNVVGYNRNGTGLGSVRGIEMRGLTGTVSGNVVYDWLNPTASEAQAYVFNGGGSAVFENNQGYQPTSGWCFERPTTGFTVRNNKWFWNGSPPREMAMTNGETGSTRLSVAPADPKFRISDYMASLGMSGALPEFVAQVRLQSPQNWRTQFASQTINDWVRVRVGLPPIGGGGPPPPTCYANCDASTGTPALTANDFQCFLTRFIANDPWANCDASTGIPILTANDYLCYLNKFIAGCP